MFPGGSPDSFLTTRAVEQYTSFVFAFIAGGRLNVFKARAVKKTVKKEHCLCLSFYLLYWGRQLF